MEFFNVLSARDVRSMLDCLASAYTIGTQEVYLVDAIDRITAKDYIADVNLPDFNRSTVDGYAVKCEDVMGSSEAMPSFLNCVSEVGMGEATDVIIASGQAVYVPTGGMVPNGASGMVMIEYVHKLDDQTLLIHKPVSPGENMTLIGDDLCEGELIVPKGKRLTAYDIGLLAAMGVGMVSVYKKPKCAIISTGDEIIDTEEARTLGQIRDVNGYALYALVKQLGGNVVRKVIVKDNFNLLHETLKEAVGEADLVLISGGSSVGTRDYTKNVIESFEEGEVFVHGISIKPGKPTIIGKIKDKVIFGLPGHPASALIVFHAFVKGYLLGIMNKCESSFSITAVLDSNVHSSPGKETYQMVQLEKTDQAWKVIPIYGKSGMMTLLTKASGYIKISEDQEGLKKGELVEVSLFQEVNV